VKIAVTKSTLLVPPTYFAVSHAMVMRDKMDFAFFTFIAEIADPSVNLPIQEFAPLKGRDFASREKFIPLAMPSMARAIANYSPDVIHQHFATWSWPAVAAAKERDTPLLTTLHGADVMLAGKKPRSIMQHWQQYNIHLAQRRSSRILAVSEYLASQAIEHGFPADKLHVHYQGVDTSLFVPDCSASPNERPRVLFVGALNDQKGIQHLVQASQALIASRDHELVIIGRGPLGEELDRLSSQQKHIRMLGQLGRAEVREELRQATVLVAPSRLHNGRREAAGLVLLEAQASGTPVVAYASGGTSEMVAPQGGTLVKEDDVDGLRRAIEEVLHLDETGYNQLSAAAREYVVRERSLLGSTVELARHYEEVTGLHS
jgi:glycosyltransferase involved in cell wall biosynthesis